MTNNNDLQTRSSLLDEMLYQCGKCGLCQAACALYQWTGEERSTARGRLRLIKALTEGDIGPSPAYADRVYRCLMCGACSATCPSGIEVEELFLDARIDLAGMDLLPEPLVQLADTLVSTGNLTGEPCEARLSWTENLEFAPPQDGTHDMVYLVGCVSSLYPQAYRMPQSMVRLLESADVDYAVLGGKEICCGYPLLVSGLRDEAREVARANLDEVLKMGAAQVLMTCPSCYRMWQEFYPQLLDGDLGVQVLHATQWLAESSLEFGRIDRKVAFHDPCDLGRGCDIYQAPREVLSRIQGLELVEMPRTRAEALCCGGGGSMESLDPAGTKRMAERRLAEALGVEAEALVSACPQCKRTLSGAKSAQLRIPTIDIVELAWDAVSRGQDPVRG